MKCNYRRQRNSSTKELRNLKEQLEELQQRGPQESEHMSDKEREAV